MLRSFAAVIVLSCFSTSAWTQVQPTPPVAGTEATKPAAKPAIRKPAARSEPAGKPASVRNGPCGLGVIVSVGDEFMVKTIGLTVFQNRETVVPIESWGLNDLVFARVRAAVPPGVTVLRIPTTNRHFRRARSLKHCFAMRERNWSISCGRSPRARIASATSW
jgi:hypothetical protein